MGYIAWIDVETTGLSPETSQLLQVACIVTDENLQQVKDAFMEVVSYRPDEVVAMKANTTPYVQEMHEKTGLWGALTKSKALPLQEIDAQLAQHLQFDEESAGIGNESLPRLGGNSITLDRNFLAAYLPGAYSKLHYRSLDMSTVAGMFTIAAPDFPQFQKRGTHDALDDIRESISEARHYMNAMKSIH